MGNCWSCLGRTIRRDRQYRYRPLRSSDEFIQSLEEVLVSASWRNDRQEQPVQFQLHKNSRRNEFNQSREQAHGDETIQQQLPTQTTVGEVSVVNVRRDKSTQSIEEAPGQQSIPSALSEHQPSMSQTTGGDVSVVTVSSMNNPIQTTEESLQSTSSESQPPTPQTPATELSVEKVRSDESTQSTKQIPVDEPVPSTSYSTEHQPSAPQTPGGELPLVKVDSV